MVFSLNSDIKISCLLYYLSSNKATSVYIAASPYMVVIIKADKIRTINKPPPPYITLPKFTMLCFYNFIGIEHATT